MALLLLNWNHHRSLLMNKPGIPAAASSSTGSSGNKITAAVIQGLDDHQTGKAVILIGNKGWTYRDIFE